MNRLFVRPCAWLAVLGLGGCAFTGKPPLPEHASLEPAGKPAVATDYRALVQNADVIYFPQERAASGARSEPSALLLEAVQGLGKPFTIAWGGIEVGQQDLLDELAARKEGAREEGLARLEVAGSGRAREHCRALLRGLPGVAQIALRPPQALADKVIRGLSLTSEEKLQLPVGFKLPKSGFQNFAQRWERSASGLAPIAAYRAQLLRQEFAADKVVRYFRGAAPETRLIVFLDLADLAPGRGVPYFVAQKLSLRQLVLGPNEPERGRLLTELQRKRPLAFQVVDFAPASLRD